MNIASSEKLCNQILLLYKALSILCIIVALLTLGIPLHYPQSLRAVLHTAIVEHILIIKYCYIRLTLQS